MAGFLTVDINSDIYIYIPQYFESPRFPLKGSLKGDIDVGIDIDADIDVDSNAQRVQVRYC